MESVVIKADVSGTFSLASQQNAYPVIRRAVLTAISSVTTLGEDERQYIRDISVRLLCEPNLVDAEEWLIDRLELGQSTTLQDRPLRVSHTTLSELTEELKTSLTFEITYIDTKGDSKTVRQVYEVQFLPADYWGGERRQPDLLAAFVQPNTTYVESLCSKTSQLLRKTNQGSAIDGYQSNTRERPYLYGSALWTILFNERFTYLSPPNGWAKTGQRIRSSADIAKFKTAACLDTSVLFSSCLENMGLNPVIALTKGHAFAGFWLIDESFPLLTNDDPMDLRKRIASSDLVMFETTLVTNDSPVTFKQAVDRANELLSEEHADDFVMLIDIKQARSRRIKPISSIEAIDIPAIESESGTIDLALGTVPVLPPVRADERVFEETPQTRLDTWQRKLLDLTKRNPLINVKSSVLKLFCPNLASLEDMLAEGTKFGFIAAEETPLMDEDRSAEFFRMRTGNDLHKEYALQRLVAKQLVVNETTKRTETKLIELLRKAKNDMEEGGSNTLFLAIGMLAWRETPESDRTYRAPLILLPVLLERKSAQAPIYMRQIPDEEPIFNLTLIELLKTDYAINLDCFSHSLPEDESGVDVHAIWSTVRDAIKEQKGFEVVEEIVLGSFSFAKYLMWKDLRDRVEVLKRSPFVEHLVDRPTESYHQESRFIESKEVDEKVNPEEFFAPLNCDSSQMVAVEASAHPQDFILEGPPGTGKSETITNIICHNLAMGRKVLFVAEKMAALQVVYRRMEKVGLAHLCLELHSNKANKKSVLDQLGQAWAVRETAPQSVWIEKARQLKTVRHHLNRYVSELHYKHALGLSARETMARAVRFQSEHPLRLTWVNDLSQAPVTNEKEMEAFLEFAKEMGVIFSEVSDLNPDNFASISQTDWSNQWRTDTVSLANQLRVALADVGEKAETILRTLDLTIDPLTPSKLRYLESLKPLIDLVLNENVDFVLTNGGQQRLAKLTEVQALHQQLISQVDEFGHSLKWSQLDDLPFEAWIAQRNEATGLFSFFKRGSLRKAMMQKGLAKVTDFSILEQGIEARETLGKIKAVEADMDNVSVVWKGCDSDPQVVSKKLEQGAQALKLFKRFVVAFTDHQSAVIALRKHLIEAKEFLSEGSAIVKAANLFTASMESFNTLSSQASSLSITIDQERSLQSLIDDYRTVADNSEKLSRWCRWLSAKQKARDFDLMSLADALEQRMVRPDECYDNALTAVSVWLAPQLVDQSDVLRQFAGATHESTIESFKELDKEVSETAAEFIAAKMAGNIPDRNAKNTPKEYGVLSRELTKKSRHKPVRQLVNEMGSSLLDLTPCFMMSPLSVAQFLPTDFDLFDLVVFDEASQITTWDAVGAVARGKNVIVVGDPKQMPPSNNFGRKEDEDSDEGDLESILDQALAARLPHLRLTGHYRSRHETLIAFSNAHYYDNALRTFPSAETKESAVTLHRVEGVYAKGKTQTNPTEAQAVVNEVVRRLEAMLQGAPLRTMGIVTINSNQQRLVDDLMDEARRNNPQLERFFTATDTFDPVFVKNLESVQGDERDIIILSLTYGPTEAGSRTMSMNFGPLNKEGGERRLNVAVTRATTEVLVFSSFDSSMVDLSRTQARAVEHLKNYLEFAERGPQALAEFTSADRGVDQFDSDFEMAVAGTLRDKGWKVQTQVGVSKFRIDLGIIHPDHPGEYLAGVECDGATYHGSPSARDRDRVRQVILENLGWNIVRLWSTDYFQDPEYAMRKVLEKLDSVLEADRAKRVEPKPEKAENIIEMPSMPDTQESTEDEIEDISDDIDVSDHQVEMQKVARVVTVNPDVTPATETQSLEKASQPLVNGAAVQSLADFLKPTLNKDDYFEDSHREVISDLAKQILEIKNGITLHELTQDIAKAHGLSRSSKAQRQHLREIIKGWAGMQRKGDEKTTVWRNKADISDVIPWRGARAFGDLRQFRDLPYEEQIGFAQEAKQSKPADSVDWMFEAFEIKRRHENTAETFKAWIHRLSNELS